ncbi:hypothetical protein V6N11_069088 [Hibiscus sabdariffa]|uniref:CCHC-type domain-containing protein n=1 Tax=Hibiscus sabdariffa TaxID=183260 RepID=A0ABR2A6J2_9ROSI
MVSKLLVNGRIQVVEYESLPTICFNCGKYGHVSASSPGKVPEAECDATPLTNTAQPPGSVGPWIIGERCQRRTSRNLQAQELAKDVDHAHHNTTGIRSNDQQCKGKTVAMPKKQRVVHLDRAQHSSIVISENSDPNLQGETMAPHVSPTYGNPLTLGKPLDPRNLQNSDPGTVNIREKLATYVLVAVSLLVAQATTMLE